MTTREMTMIIIKSIFSAPRFTITEWQKLFADYSEGDNTSISTISGWKNGTHAMRTYYQKILIKIICTSPEMKKYQSKIKNIIINNLGFKQHQRLYWELDKKDFNDFIQYILNELTVKDISNLSYTWEKISIKTLIEMCIKKIQKMQPQLQFNAKDNQGDLLLTYYGMKKQEYQVTAGFLFGQSDTKTLEKEISNFYYRTPKSIVKYIFVTVDISDELYIKILEQYGIFLLKIDEIDVEHTTVMETYVEEAIYHDDYRMLRFFNLLADTILQKLQNMNLIVLKDILDQQFDFSEVKENFFSSNSGIWKYQYPIRRELAFEEKLINKKLRVAAKQGKNKLNILDINLTGGLLGLRLSFHANQVTCVDITHRGIASVKKITEKYNHSKSLENTGIFNVNYGYIRIDSMKIIGIVPPEDGYDLIILGLGAGSYVQNLQEFIQQLGNLLKKSKENKQDGGAILLSVYNKDALCYTGNHLAKMDFSYDGNYFRHLGEKWSLPAILYTHKEICSQAIKFYNLQETYSYPTILSVISADQETEILEKLKEIDKEFANKNQDVSDRGLFHLLYMKKNNMETVERGNQLIHNYIEKENIILHTIQHEKITSRDKMLRELNRQGILAGDNFVKTIVMIDEKWKRILFILLPLTVKLKRENLKEWYLQNEMDLVKRKLRFCSEKELQDMGLASGSVSPFAYPIIQHSEEYQKSLLCDKNITETDFRILYTYSGNLEITFQIQKSELQAYLKKNNADFLEWK